MSQGAPIGDAIAFRVNPNEEHPVGLADISTALVRDIVPAGATR